MSESRNVLQPERKNAPGLEMYRAFGLGGTYCRDEYVDRDFYLFRTEYGVGLVLVDGTRVHLIDNELALILERVSRNGTRDEVRRSLVQCGFEAQRLVDDQVPSAIRPRAFSLAIAQKCNLGCTYCYASGGDFGNTPKHMTLDVAFETVDRLMRDTPKGENVNLAFLGGEPMMNRKVLMATTEYAAEQAARRGVVIGFSLTTNGTLIRLEDVDFLERHGFAVTISLDGIGEAHDTLRPFKSGRGSFQHIISHIEPLLRLQNRMQVLARVTVTPRNLDLRRTLEYLFAIGFRSVGFSPMISSPTGADQMNHWHFRAMFDQMVDCGREFERRVLKGEFYPFSNMDTSLREIHRGTHRPYSCGAGGGYFGVSADGEISACHRFVGEDVGQMGHINTGVDQLAQNKWLSVRHVHQQSPCNNCWARYMCGGGCHHEVLHRGRVGCEFIRGWLHFTLQSYIRIRAERPDFFEAPSNPDYASGSV